MTDWQLSFNGLTVGPGTSIGVVSVDGWLDMQGVTTADTPKPNADGTWSSPDWFPSRLVNVILDIADDVELFADAVQALEAATQNQSAPAAVTLTIPGRLPETIYAKVRARAIPTEFEYQMGLVSAAKVSFWAQDPRRYSTPIVATTPLPSATGGLIWPVRWPVTWPVSKLTGSVSIANPGTAAGPLKFRIDGPCTAPQIIQVGTGRILAFSNALTLTANDWLDVDMDARTVLDRGQSSRAGYVSQRGWFALEPGFNLIAFNAADYDDRALLTVTATPAWK